MKQDRRITVYCVANPHANAGDLYRYFATKAEAVLFARMIVKDEPIAIGICTARNDLRPRELAAAMLNRDEWCYEFNPVSIHMPLAKTEEPSVDV